MLELNECQMLNHPPTIFGILSTETTDIEVGIHSITQGKVISFSQYLNSMREISLSPYILLKSGTSGPPTIDLPVEKRFNNELSGECVNMGLHNLRRIGSSKGPHYIASCITDMLTHRMVPSVNVIDKSFI